jgi:hypothetical protein
MFCSLVALVFGLSQRNLGNERFVSKALLALDLWLSQQR